jgi:predicted CXXCH cytochrome family protein
MFKHMHTSVFLAVLLSYSCLWAKQKPTEPTENCTEGECHKSYLQKKHVHKPVALGVCKFCHKLVDPKEHTFKLFRTKKELCGSCHEEQTRDLNTIPSVAQLKEKAPQVAKGKYLHKPLKEGKCIDCHNPHSSDYKFFLSAAKIGETCRGECHKLNENVKNPHKPVADGECDLCHNSHSSNYRYLLINNQRQLCFSCHEDTKADLDRFKYIHEPVAELECGVCHESHGSDYFRLLVKQYPPEFYAPFDISNYDLCFSCHQADKVLVKETENLTDFRNGKTNLHYLHVNMSEKGRTCRTCHASHASNEPKQLRKEVPYGGWEIPIQFEKTETGGGCSPGCHDPRTYDRIKPVICSSDKSQ